MLTHLTVYKRAFNITSSQEKGGGDCLGEYITKQYMLTHVTVYKKRGVSLQQVASKGGGGISSSNCQLLYNDPQWRFLAK